MPSRFSYLLFGITAAAFVFGLALPAAGAETESSELIIITEDDVVTGDLYAVGNRILIRGRIEGDLIALAGEDVRIEGEVTGSVMAMAPEVVVTGAIGNSLRATSPDVLVEGTIAGDVFVGSVDFGLSADGIIEGDLVLWAWNADLAGLVGGNLEGSLRSLRLAGEVGHEVAVAVRRLTVTDTLEVGGDLTYRSDDDAEGIEQAKVGGAVVRQEPLPPNIRLRALGLVGRFMLAIVLSATALLVVWRWPERTEEAMEGFRTHPIGAYLLGGLVMIVPALLTIVAFLIYSFTPSTAALPLVGAMVPLILASFGLVLALALISGIPVIAWLGTFLGKKLTIAGAVGMGAAVASIFWLLPVVGWLVPLLALTGGLGGWIYSFREADKPESATA